MATREPGVTGESRTPRNRVEDAITTPAASVPKRGETRYIISGNERFRLVVADVIPQGETFRVRYKYPGELYPTIFTEYDKRGNLIAPRFVNIVK